jgi:ribonucleoside-diphosphate reductase alpha chain
LFAKIILFVYVSFDKFITYIFVAVKVCSNVFPELVLASDGLGMKNTFTLGKVKSVKSIGYMETFDVEVENDHWFYAGAVKSHNTASLVLGCASGIHAWHNTHYLRRMRINKDEAIYSYLVEKLGKEFIEDDSFNPTKTAVLGIPIKAPEGSILRTETPNDLLERVKRFQIEWIRGSHIDGINTHNVSVTVSIKPDEWPQVTKWMWDNKDFYNGISVLDYDGGTYPQMPFEDISENQYYNLSRLLEDRAQHFNITEIIEEDDYTDLQGEAACAGGSCTLV